LSRRCACTPTRYCDRCAALLARATGTPAVPPGGAGGDVTHAQMQHRVRDIARALGYKHYHAHKPRLAEEAGFPDSVLVHPSLDTTLYFMELKTVDDKPTEDQRRWLEALARVERVEAGIVRPSTLAEFVTLLRVRSA
jgi:hypothetical protein